LRRAQWFPGAMARAMRRLKEDLALVDLVVELIDARAPASSRNPRLLSLCRQKERLILLHKADRGEEEINTRWLLHFRESGEEALLSSVQLPRTLKPFFDYLELRRRRLLRGRLKRALRLVIVGIPNVGKSTLINYLAGRAAARTGDQPGITRGRQWFRLTPGVELLDTPGILPPVLSPERIFPLAAIGALPPGRADPQEVAAWLLRLCLERGKTERLEERYEGLQPAAPEAMLQQIGAIRGCFLTQGKVDLDRAAMILLRDYGAGKLGRFSLEEPPG